MYAHAIVPALVIGGEISVDHNRQNNVQTAAED